LFRPYFEPTFKRTHDRRNHRVQGDRRAAPVNENGNIAWTFEGEPTTSREKRWLELYMKQERAEQKGETADQPIDSTHDGRAA
jgi:hypothetical protein